MARGQKSVENAFPGRKDQAAEEAPAEEAAANTPAEEKKEEAKAE